MICPHRKTQNLNTMTNGCTRTVRECMYISEVCPKNTDNGATLTYTFTGTGLEILGEMKKTCTVQMTVDGNQHAKQETQKSANMNMTVAVTDLVYGKHVVTVEVLDGTMAVDMVGILGAKHAQKEPDVQPTKRPNVKPTQTPSVQPTVKPTAAPQQTPKADRPNSPKKGNEGQ